MAAGAEELEKVFLFYNSPVGAVGQHQGGVMAEGTAEVAPEGEEGAGHLFVEIQQGELLQTFDEHRGLLGMKFFNIYCVLAGSVL